MKDYMRYVTGVLLLIGAIILIILMFNFIRNIFKDDGPSNKNTSTKQTVNLIEAGSTGEAVRYTQYGRVIGGDNRRTIQITVNKENRKIEILQGYNGQVVKSDQQPNTEEGYKAFVAALNGAGFASSVAPEGRGDEAQSCPLGLKYSFEVSPNQQNHFRTWTTSCGSSKQGTFTGRRNTVHSLFLRQIPNYTSFTAGTKL